MQITITEKQVENQILTFLRNKGIFVWKNQSVGVFNPTRKSFMKSRNPHHINGVADILGCIDGKMLAIEVKKPYVSKRTMKVMERSQEQLAKLASDDQVLFINNVRALGAVAFYADSLDIVKEHLKSYLIS